MSLEKSYRLFTWLKANVKDGDCESYSNLARRASNELGENVSPTSVKSAVDAACIKIQVSRSAGKVALKKLNEELQLLVAMFKGVLFEVLNEVELNADTLSAYIDDEDLPEPIRRVFRVYLENRVVEEE